MQQLMRTLTIIELPSGGFVLKGSRIEGLYCNPEEGPISVCPKLGNNYEYPNSLDTLPGAVWAFFKKPEPPLVE